MPESAKRGRSETAERIALCAQRLVDERGFDGFTMDELAEDAGVSRRTLFNYYPGKVDAVLGPWPGLDPDDVAVFRAGGPHRDLVLDLSALIDPILDAKNIDRDVLLRMRRILMATPRLMVSVHQRYEELSAEVVGHVVAREGTPFGPQRAKVAVALLAALFDATIDAYLADGRNRALTHHFDESLRTARSLLGG